MKTLRFNLLFILLLPLILSGCATSMKSVSQYAATSAKAIEVINAERPRYVNSIPRFDTLTQEQKDFYKIQDQVVDNVALVLQDYFNQIAKISDPKEAKSINDSLLVILKKVYDQYDPKIAEQLKKKYPSLNLDRYSDYSFDLLGNAILELFKAHRKYALMKALDKGNTACDSLLDYYSNRILNISMFETVRLDQEVDSIRDNINILSQSEYMKKEMAAKDLIMQAICESVVNELSARISQNSISITKLNSYSDNSRNVIDQIKKGVDVLDDMRKSDNKHIADSLNVITSSVNNGIINILKK